ncbi:hypothetical protein BHE74_00042533, partial [Ensete ventricosum]
FRRINDPAIGSAKRTLRLACVWGARTRTRRQIGPPHACAASVFPRTFVSSIGQIEFGRVRGSPVGPLPPHSQRQRANERVASRVNRVE